LEVFDSPRHAENQSLPFSMLQLEKKANGLQQALAASRAELESSQTSQTALSTQLASTKAQLDSCNQVLGAQKAAHQNKVSAECSVPAPCSPSVESAALDDARHSLRI
jgi:phage shock protein A